MSRRELHGIGGLPQLPLPRPLTGRRHKRGDPPMPPLQGWADPPAMRIRMALPGLLMSIALMTGCLPEWTARPLGAPRVAAVGDSILRQLEFGGPTHPSSNHALTLSIQEAGWRASVEGENGWRIARIRQLAAEAA